MSKNNQEYMDQENLNEKKKELSEVSGSQFLGEPSASDTSPSWMPEEVRTPQVNVPAPFGEIPKLKPSAAVKTAKEEEVKPTISDWWSDKWNGLIEGIEGFAANVRDETNRMA